MNDGLRQRIAGALVLGALGLIILPVMFDFVDPHKIDKTSRLPPPPELQPVDVVKAERPLGAETPEEVDTLFNTTGSTPDRDRQGPDFGLDANDLPKAWVLQLGSFLEKPKAEEFEQRLQSAGFKSFIKGVDVSGKHYFRVYVGPKIDRRKALEAKSQIDQKFGTDAIMLQYVP